jgi:hypothetical protein
MIPCAFLRIFRPLEAFGEPERAEWERYIVSGTAPPPGPPRYRHLAPEAGTPFGFLEAVEGDHAEVRFEDGRYYVCPWRTHLRALASIVSMRESLPEEGSEPLVSEADARRAARELARVRRSDPTLIPSMLQSPWHVPVRWFVMFEERERRMVESTGGDVRLRYWAPIGPAARRALRAASVLRRVGLEPVSGVVGEMAEWLSMFDRRSMLELDYGTLSSLFTWDELDDDHSAAEIQAAIDALEGSGGMPAAGELYQAVAGRWAETRARESLN